MNAKVTGMSGVMNFNAGVVADLKGVESYVSCRLARERTKFDRNIARGRTLVDFPHLVVPAERAEYVREQLRYVINAFAEQAELFQEAQDLVQTAADGTFKEIDRKAAQDLADRMYSSIRRVQGDAK